MEPDYQIQSPKKTNKKNSAIELSSQSIIKIYNQCNDRQSMQEAIAKYIKPLNFKQKDQLQQIVHEVTKQKYCLDEDPQANEKEVECMIHDYDLINIGLRDTQVSTPIADVFFHAFIANLREALQKGAINKQSLLKCWSILSFRNIQEYLKQFQLEQDFRNLNQEQFIKFLTSLLSDNKIQQCCVYYLQYHPIEEFEQNYFASKIATSDQICSTVVIKTLKQRPKLKQLVLKHVDIAKGVLILEHLNEDPREYPHVLKYILRKHYLSMLNQYKEWFIFQDKMSFNPTFIQWYCEDQELEDDVRESILIRNNLKEKREDFALIPNPLYSNDAFTITQSILTPGIEEKQFIMLRDFNLFIENVHFIDCTQTEQFQKMKEDVLSSQKVGFDAENRCTSTKYEMQGVALIQISTEKQVYLIDFLHLESDLKFLEFFALFLENPQIIKLGHTVQSDIKYLSRTIKIEGNNGFVDISKIFKQKYPNEIQTSLAFMTKVLLGKKLSKFQQRSNWNRRPLKLSQLHYSALDAVICLELQKILSVKGVQITHSVKKKQQSVSDVVRLENMAYDKQYEGLLTAERPKFLADSMLKKLCSIMRNLGIDTEYANISDYNLMLQTAEKQHRIILTRDTKLLKKKNQKTPIYCIAQKGDSQLMFEQVKKQFNIDLSQFKPLSRCVKCNGEQLLVISRQEAMKCVDFQYNDTSITEFWQCFKCKQVYWEGKQFERAKKQYEGMK